MPLLLLVNIRRLLYALVNVFHPDWPIRSNFRLHRSDNLHKDSHQNSWINPRVKTSIKRDVKGQIATVLRFTKLGLVVRKPINLIQD